MANVVFGEEDLKNAGKYADERAKLAMVNLIRQKHPHLAFFDVSVEQATQNDYGFEDQFKKRAIKVTVDVSRRQCQKMSCDPFMKEARVCGNNDRPRNEWIGTGPECATKCGPVCFNLDPLKEDKTKVQSINCRWRNNRCEFVTQGDTWLQQPWVRDTTRFSKDTYLAYGFDLQANGVYKLNQNFCDSFGTVFDGTDCSVSKAEEIAGYFLGSTLIKTVRHVIEHGFTKPTYDSIQHDDRNAAPPLDSWMSTVAGWQNDVVGGKDFDEEVDVGGSIRRGFAHDTGKVRRNVSLEGGGRTRNKRETRVEEETEVPNDAESPLKNTSDQTWVDTLKTYILKMLESLGDPDTLMYIGADITLHQFMELVSTTLKTTITKLVTRLESSDTIIQLLKRGFLTESIFSGASELALKDMSRRIAGRIVSKTSVFILEILSSALDVVGVVLDVAILFDLVLTFWDPFDFNKGTQYSPAFLQSIFDQTKDAFMTKNYMSSLKVSFETMTFLLLSNDDFIELFLKKLQWTSEYLSHLTITSEGTVVNPTPTLRTQVQSTDVSLMLVNLHLWDPQQVTKDVSVFKHRLTTMKQAMIGTWVVGLAGLLAGAFLNSILVVIICLFVMFVINMTTRYYSMSPNSTWLFNALDN